MADVREHERAVARVWAALRWRAVLFTDIVDSTRQWNERGDVEGRLQLEQHDQLIHPIVELYHGWLVKTIGDSVFACFAGAVNALLAAVARQRPLADASETDADSDLLGRSGLPGGKVVVEKDDVYGDPVNVAARVVSEAEGGTILISGALYRRIDRDRYCVERLGSFTPRGKRSPILLYRVSWWRDGSRLAPLDPPKTPKPPRPPRAPLRFRWRAAFVAQIAALILGLHAAGFGPATMAAHLGSAVGRVSAALDAFASTLGAGDLVSGAFAALSTRMEAHTAAPGLAGLAVLALLSFLPFGLRWLRGTWAATARFLAGALGMRLFLLAAAPPTWLQASFVGGSSGALISLSRVDAMAIAFGLALAARPRLLWLVRRPPLPATAMRAPLDEEVADG